MKREIVFVVMVAMMSTLISQSTANVLAAANVEARLNEFLHAAMSGDVAMMMQLLDGGFGITVNDRNLDGETALMIAAINGQTETVRWLLDDRYAHKEIRDASGQTALLFAVKFNRPMIAAMLLNRGAQVNTADIWGNTPLMFAVDSGNVRMAELLIEQGADNMATAFAGKWSGQTPLTLAYFQNKPDMVRRLARSNIATKFFKLKYSSNSTWEDSLIRCAERNARLAQIKNAAERDAIKYLAVDATATSGCSGYWLGGRSTEKGLKSFEWIGDRSPIIVANWAQGQPDRSGCTYDADSRSTEFCIRILQTGEWDDVACTHKEEMDGAICEYF